MKILMINGSPRKTGRTGIASRYITKMHGVDFIDLSVLDVPIFNGEKDQNELASVKHIRTSVSEADGIIMASPEYHSGMSGALKNALDFLGSEHFANKPVALLAVAGGGKGGINALNNMRTVARGLYANAIPKQLVLDPHCFNYENDGLNDTAATQVNGLIEELKIYVRSFSIMKA
ncbi:MULTISPECIES: NADPH-dependent FMN reductase [unclassified Bacillus (in: firmicutes)]|uniref:NADPH-dependent FMN reductase n=1 Tax=unclassified Bacillus (in: firmicutes) TaxID=185979 RepID=UPI0008EA0D3A|nr:MULTISPECIES: NADPH-dependent FMN reductase [unclassified Bacillus (in: firmicutes)]SFA80871.1 azobenzene reductase [Bacillus sp. UNCCL13]SFQ71008.1 azobenzene reductase [Bacillus sp. cl95]